MNLRKLYFLRQHDSGSILIVSIWVLAIFSIIAVGLSRLLSSQIRLTKTLENRFYAQYLAESALLYAKVIEAEDQTEYDSLYELCQIREHELGRGKFIYTLIDETGKININSSSQEIIARLPGMDAVLAQKIKESELMPVTLTEELLLIDGVTEEIYLQCKDFITVYTDGKVNINTVGEEVLSALGMEDGLITIVKNYRAGLDGQEGTEDDDVFESLGTIVNNLVSFTQLSQEQEEMLLELVSQGYLSIGSDSYHLDIEAQLNGKTVKEYDIFIDRGVVKYWEE